MRPSRARERARGALSRASRWWLAFAAASLVVTAGLAWLSAATLGRERDAAAAAARERHEARVRLALYRMDSWFGAVLAREAGRRSGEYRPLEGDRPSPLHGFRSELLLQHFEWRPESGLDSPRLPPPESVRPPGVRWAGEAEARAVREELDRLDADVDFDALLDRATRDGRDAAGASTTAGGLVELQRRQRLEAMCSAPDAVGLSPASLGEDGGRVSVGRLVPDWSGNRLLYMRAVDEEGLLRLQGFEVAWPALAATLATEAADLLSEARLVAAPDPAAVPAARRLATVPARIEAAAPKIAMPVAGPTLARLLVVWLSAALALAAVGLALRASIAQGERRARLAAAVGHELRTPLTTFRLYSELLADGVVTDEAERQEYLDTLKGESERLASLVENVLAHARLEESGAPPATERLTVGELLERTVPALRARVSRSGLGLDVDDGGHAGALVRTDPRLVGRVLLELVENACKHAAAGSAAPIRLAVTRGASAVRIALRDGGPGIPAELARTVFEPFQRGARAEDETTPGVGLGLALCRGLARELGGDLRLVPVEGPGACFRLSLPVP